MDFWCDRVAKIEINTAPAWHECARDWSWAPRPLPDFDFWFVAGGHGTLRFRDENFALHRGVCFLWEPGDAPSARHDPAHPLRVFACHFSPLDALGEPLSAPNWPRPVELRDLAFSEASARRAVALWQRDARVETRRLLRSLLWQIEDEIAAPPAPHDAAIEAVAERLRQDCARGWQLDEMAREAHLSRAQFTRRFRARFGSAPGEWLLHLRVENARQMLLESDATLESIARATGFCDAAHFSRAFKKLSGRAPGALRRR